MTVPRPRDSPRPTAATGEPEPHARRASAEAAIVWRVIRVRSLPASAPPCARGARPSDVGAADVHRRHRSRPASASRHDSGAFGKKYLPETMGSGGAFLDVDGDGWQDILLVNSMTWPGRPAARSLPALYRNNRDGTFTDVTRAAGLGVEMYGLGVAAADYDNDGRIDLYVTALGKQPPVPEPRRRRFADVTARAGVGDPGSRRARPGSTTTATAGSICSSPTTSSGRSRRTCSARSTARPSPTARPSRTRARARRSIATAATARSRTSTTKAGLYDPPSKALGVALLDYDGDGWLDLFVANDTQPNRLYGTSGTARSPTSASRPASRSTRRASRAPAWASTPPTTTAPAGQSLVIGNFSNEMMALYQNEGNGLFIDEAPALDHRQGVAADADLRLLLLRLRPRRPARHLRRQRPRRRRHQRGAAAGHLRAAAAPVPQPRQPPLRSGDGHVPARRFSKPMVARGAAYGDYDGDGDLDLLDHHQQRPGAPAAQRRRRAQPPPARASSSGTTSNRDAIGAFARVTTAAGAVVRGRWSRPARAICSQSELPLTFGLGARRAVVEDRSEVAGRPRRDAAGVRGRTSR